MAYSAPNIELVRDNIIRVHHPELLEPKTYMTAASAASASSITVKDNVGFSNTDPQDLLLLGAFGAEGSEVTRIAGAVTAGTSLTTQTLVFGHAVDTPVSKILFNHFEVRGSDTSEADAASTNGTIVQFNGANTSPINVSGAYTDFVITGTTYTYYSVRFYNSLVTTPYYGSFADGVTASTGYDPKEVGFIIRNAFSNVSENPGGIYDREWIFDQIYLGELDVMKELKRWSFTVVNDYDTGNIATGVDSITLPTNIEDNQTRKSILGVRVGTNDNINYVDRPEFEDLREGVAHTTLSSAIQINDTTVSLTDSRDFEDSGSINIDGTSYSYTGNTRSTNTLTGFTAFTSGVDNATDVWQGIDFGEPLQYTIDDGTLYFVTPPSSDYNGRNVWMSYYKTVTRVNSEGDSITVNDPYLIQLWLEIQIKKKKGDGNIALDDISIIEYDRRKKKLIDNELTGTHLYLVPGGLTMIPKGDSSLIR